MRKGGEVPHKLTPALQRALAPRGVLRFGRSRLIIVVDVDNVGVTFVAAVDGRAGLHPHGSLLHLPGLHLRVRFHAGAGGHQGVCLLCRRTPMPGLSAGDPQEQENRATGRL